MLCVSWELLVILQVEAEWKAKRRRLGFVSKKREEEGRRGGRLEPSFSIMCFAPSLPPSLTRPTLRIVRPQWRRHNKRGSVRQKLVWVAIYSVMVGSESKVEAHLWRKFCRKVEQGFSWLWCRNVQECPMMLKFYKVDARPLWGGAGLASHVEKC